MNGIDDPHIFPLAARLIRKLLNENAAHLDTQSQEVVRHYLDHDEYEMAFEGLFLDLIAHGSITSCDKLDVYLALGRSLNLEKESVLDGQFWPKLMRFVQDNA